jgi:hypothetical protein
MYLQARVNNLEGRNDELRKELRESRYECTKAKVDSEKMQAKVRVFNLTNLNLKWKRVNSILNENK